MKAGAWLTLVLLLMAPQVSAQDSSENERAGVEESLRARVTKFYGYFKQGKYRQAEQLVAEESRDAFYGANKTKILGFEISKVDLEPDFQKAKVVVMCKMVAPMGIGPIPAPLHSEWRQQDGEWFLFLQPRKAGDEVQTPFGKTHVVEMENAPDPPMPAKRPNAGSLKRMYQVRGKRALIFRSKSDIPLTRTVTVFNPGPARLSLRRETRDIAAIEVTESPAEIDPGEEITISFTYHPEVTRLRGARKVTFTVIPLNQRFSIGLEFKD